MSQANGSYGIWMDENIETYVESRIHAIGHVKNVPTMQLFTGISRNTQSKSNMLSLSECVWEFRNNAPIDMPYLQLHTV
mgnify:CR=1 FL=1